MPSSPSAPSALPLAKERSLWRRLGFVARMAVSGGLVWYVLSGTNWSEIFAELRELRIAPLIVALVIYLLSQFASSIRWWGLARAVGFDRTRGQMIGLYFEGMFFSTALPSSIGGDVIKAYRLGTTNQDRILAAFTVIVDRLTGFVWLLAMVVVAVAHEAFALTMPQTIGVGIGFVLSMLGCFHLAIWLARRHSARINRIPRLGPILARLHPYYEQPVVLLRALRWGLIVQICNIWPLVWIGESMGLDAKVPPHAYWMAGAIVSGGTALPISINGIGVREVVLWRLLGQYGVTQAEGTVLGTLWLLNITLGGLSGVVPFLAGRAARQAAGPTTALAAEPATDAAAVRNQPISESAAGPSGVT